MNRVTKLKLKGYKTFRDADLELGPLNVLIGPNGAGKSNLLSFFRLLSWMTDGRLQEYLTTVEGSGSKVLHDGPETTELLEAELSISTDKGQNDYAFKLAYAAEDRLTFRDERYRFHPAGSENVGTWRGPWSGHVESALREQATQKKAARALLGFLRRYKLYQFQNTTFTSRFRRRWPVEENDDLKEDGGNVAPVLFRLQEREPRTYQRIVNVLRLVMPWFHDFYFRPEGDTLLLKWREKGSDTLFNASQASDGSLRTIALVTLLNMPTGEWPDLLLIDEPELGLHPSAISLLGGMLKAASQRSQLIVATQSPTLLDSFETADVMVIERRGRESTVTRPDREALGVWLEKYSLGQVWLKNLLGGRP